MDRLTRDNRPRAVVFLTTVVVVVVISTATPLVSHLLTPPVTYPAYETGLVPDPAPASGQVGLVAGNRSGTIVIDSAHANGFDQEDIQPLIEAITDAGYRVAFAETETGIEAALVGADGLVVIDPGREYSVDEVRAVKRFVDDGGRLVMLGEPGRSRVGAVSVRSIRSRFDSLSTAFGIEFGEDYLFNTADNDGNHRNVFAAPSGDSPLVARVERTAFYTAAPVSTTNGQALLVATNGTRLVRGDTPGRYPVAVRHGNVLAVGDTTFLAGDLFNVVDNDRFIGNIARFLLSGPRQLTLEDYPALVGETPTVQYTDVTLLGAAQRIATDLREGGARPRLRLEGGGGATEGADVVLATYSHLRTHGTGLPSLTVARGRVAVPGFESETAGVIVFHSPVDGPGLVVAVTGPAKARQAAGILAEGELKEYLLNERSAVVRTATIEVTATPGANASNVSG